MRLSDFHAQIQGVSSNAHEYEVQIAQVYPTPGDDIDVSLSEVGWAEVDHESGQARLYPRAAVTEGTPDENIPWQWFARGLAACRTEGRFWRRVAFLTMRWVPYIAGTANPRP